MNNNFVKYCLSHGAILNQLIVDSSDCNGMGICNPSVLVDGSDMKYVLRNVNYMLWSCDNSTNFTSPYGPICYITEDDDMHLRTTNFIADTNSVTKVDTSMFDMEPLWEFVGLEDARLVRWNGKLYLTGVRRDTTTNGQGRMELSELDDNYREISRVRIEAPNDKTSYCEKNWMPVLDMPYHYVKWCDPLELVKVNPITGESETVKLVEVGANIQNLKLNGTTIRGSSQVVPFDDCYIAIVHRCSLWRNEKNEKSDVSYTEQFIIWDKDFNLIKISDEFKFAGFGVEFTCGLSYNGEQFIIPFALQDNMAFSICVNKNVVMNYIYGDREPGDYKLSGNEFLKFFNDTTNSYSCVEIGYMYYLGGHYAPAMVMFERASEYNTFITIQDQYECLYWLGKCFSNAGKRDIHENAIWTRMVNLCPNRSEGYLMLSKFYYYRGDYPMALMLIRLSLERHNFQTDIEDLGPVEAYYMYAMCIYHSEEYNDCEQFINDFLEVDDYDMSDEQRDRFISLKNDIVMNKSNRVRVL